MIEWIASSAAKAVLGVFGDTFVKPFVEVWAKKQDINLEKFKTESTERQMLSVAVINAEVERIKGNSAIIREAMQHRIWWWAWALFVIPVGVYHATIFVVSTLGIPPEVYTVLRVPPMQEQWAVWIVLSIFGAQTASSIVSDVASRFGKK